MRQRRSIALILSILFLCQAGIQRKAYFQQEIDNILKEYQQQKKFMGTVLIAQKGRIIFNKSYGQANIHEKIPNKNSTKYRIGSVSKQFTAAAILQLHEKGLLDINKTLADYLPGYPVKTAKKITIHHMMTHTSGLPEYIRLPEAVAYYAKPTSAEKIIDLFKDKSLEFRPGSRLKYNNSGYFLLGQIIEKVSGQTYSQYIKENIFQKIGMKNSGDLDWYKIPNKKRATGYILFETGRAKTLEEDIYLDPSFIVGAGNLYSTAYDLYRWIRALESEKILKPKTIKKALSPLSQGEAFGVPVSYGYGWFVGERFEHKEAMHIGGAP